MSGTLRFGIAGLGIASTQILAAFPGRDHLVVTAAADVRRHALEKFAKEFGGEPYDSVEEMCESPNVDAVYVCTPNHLHADHVITAARHGKHVIVEKPMALSLQETEAMIAAADTNGVVLLCGHTHSFDPPIREMRRIVRNGELGRLGMINHWIFKGTLYSPRMPQELNPAMGGNAVYNQGPHQVDIVRLIGGGMVRSVRAMTGNWDPKRPVEGSWAAYLEFEDGTPATLAFSGYAHFDTAELTFWIAEGGYRDPNAYGASRRQLARFKTPEEEWAAKEAQGYGGTRQRAHSDDPDDVHPHYGLTLVSCEHGDMRQSPDGLLIYDDVSKREVQVAHWERGRAAELQELYQAVVQGRPAFHDGRWGQATLEVVLAIMQSARERKELYMSHQVPAPE